MLHPIACILLLDSQYYTLYETSLCIKINKKFNLVLKNFIKTEKPHLFRVLQLAYVFMLPPPEVIVGERASD